MPIQELDVLENKFSVVSKRNRLMVMVLVAVIVELLVQSYHRNQWVASACSTSSMLANADAPSEEQAINRKSSKACAMLTSIGGRHE